MTIKYLKYDSDSPDGRAVSTAATMKNGDTVIAPHDHKLLYIAVPSASSTGIKVTPSFTIGGSVTGVKADLEGNAYPRSSFTGGAMTFINIPGSGFKLAATANTIWVKSAK